MEERMFYKRRILIITLIFILFFFSKIFSETQEIGGTIYFADGTSLEFYDIEDIYIALQGYNLLRRSGYIWVKFENSTREIPFSKLKSIEVLNWENKPGWALDGTVLIKTVTGLALKLKYSLFSVKIKIFDKLTGEVKNQVFDFKDQLTEKLNIKAIIFNN